MGRKNTAERSSGPGLTSGTRPGIVRTANARWPPLPVLRSAVVSPGGGLLDPLLRVWSGRSGKATVAWEVVLGSATATTSCPDRHRRAVPPCRSAGAITSGSTGAAVDCSCSKCAWYDWRAAAGTAISWRRGPAAPRHIRLGVCAGGRRSRARSDRASGRARRERVAVGSGRGQRQVGRRGAARQQGQLLGCRGWPSESVRTVCTRWPQPVVPACATEQIRTVAAASGAPVRLSVTVPER